MRGLEAGVIYKHGGRERGVRNGFFLLYFVCVCALL